MVAGFRNRFPDVTFYLQLGDPGILLTMLKKGEINFALVDVFQTRNQFFGNMETYHFQPVAQEEIILACSKQYYENAINQDHSFNHLPKQDFITYRRNSLTIEAWFKHPFGKSNRPLQPVLTIDSHQVIISAIQHHMGLGIIASHWVRKEIKQGQIIGIKTSKPEIKNEISLTQLLNKFPTVTEKAFLKFLLKEIQSIGLQVKGKTKG